MEVRHRMAAILFLSMMWFGVFVIGCEVDDVAVYKVTLRTLWNEDTFPMDHSSSLKPQWSQVFGQTHNKSYTLYHVGEVARLAVRNFAQFGAVDYLMEEGEEDPKVYDQFSSPAVVDGTGETDNMVFVDREYSKVSLICRMIPSPDWFIGVDSLDLCVDSSWIDQVTLDLEPLDGGAVNTFNDDTESSQNAGHPEPVEKISLRNPKFFGTKYSYRQLRQLPSIAKVEFTKVKEYSTKELNNLARKELISTITNKGERKGFSKRRMHKQDTEMHTEEIATKNNLELLKDLEEDPVGTPRPNVPENNVVVVTKAPTLYGETSEAEYGKGLWAMDDAVLAVANGRKLGLGKHLPRHFKSRLHHAVNRHRRHSKLLWR